MELGGRVFCFLFFVFVKEGREITTLHNEDTTKRIDKRCQKERLIELEVKGTGRNKILKMIPSFLSFLPFLSFPFLSFPFLPFPLCLQLLYSLCPIVQRCQQDPLNYPLNLPVCFGMRTATVMMVCQGPRCLWNK